MRQLSPAIILLSGIFIFTAQVPLAQQTASSAVQGEVQLLEQRKPMERELKAKEMHAYKIALEAGQFLTAAVNQRGIDLVVRVFGPDGNRIAEIDSPNGTQGDEPIFLEAKTTGTYRIEVSPLEQEGNSPAGRYEIKINEILSASDYAERLAEKQRKQRAVIAWLKDNAIPVKTVEAGNGFQDLELLKRVFKDVRFVGLGEATHGTREFFQFKHRMLEFLVKEMGFRVFAIEASYSACQNINDYVMGKTDDGAKALDSQGFWTWNTEEVRALIDWMRAYNASAPADRKVKFAGVDIQINETGKAKLLEYLRRVAPDRVATTEELFKVDLNELNATLAVPEKQKEATAKLKELQIRHNDLLVFLELRGAELAAKSSQAEYEQMREYARVISQYIDAYSDRSFRGFALRDLYMADNFRRMVEHEPAGTRVVLWAHNGHITTGDADGNRPTLGYHLRRFYGKDYYALGFSFNKGSFQSREAQPKNPAARMLMPFTVNPAPIDSIDWYLAQTGVKNLIVDFRSARKAAELAEWVTELHPMRSIGAIYAPTMEGAASFAPTTLDKEFDGLFFIDTTTRARPNPSVKNVAPAQ